MATRSGMQQLVDELRAMTDSTTDDYTYNGVTYWTDQQLQNVLDQYRQDIYREPLHPEGEYTGGTLRYYNYYWRAVNVERAASGSAAWQVEDSAGSAIGTANYTAYYEARYIRFTSHTGGGDRRLSYRTYDLNRAAAHIWRQKAAHVASRFDITTDNHTLKRSQLRQQYLQMAAHYSTQAGSKHTRMVRSDLN